MRDFPRRLGLAVTALLVLTAIVGLTARQLSGGVLCERLTAAEVGAVLGSPRSAEIGEDRCTYLAASTPAVRLLNSTSDTRQEFVDLIKTLKGTVQDGPNGSVIAAVAFDLQNGTTSGAWFILNKTPVELEFDRGIEVAKARALVEAALR